MHLQFLVVHRAGVEPAIFTLVEMIGLEPTNSTLSEWRVNQLHHISMFVKIYKILAILCFNVCKTGDNPLLDLNQGCSCL